MMVTSALGPQARPASVVSTPPEPAPGERGRGEKRSKSVGASRGAGAGRYVSGGAHRQLSAMRLLCALVPLLYLAAVGAWVGFAELVARLLAESRPDG